MLPRGETIELRIDKIYIEDNSEAVLSDAYINNFMKKFKDLSVVKEFRFEIGFGNILDERFKTCLSFKDDQFPVKTFKKSK